MKDNFWAKDSLGVFHRRRRDGSVLCGLVEAMAFAIDDDTPETHAGIAAPCRECMAAVRLAEHVVETRIEDERERIVPRRRVQSKPKKSMRVDNGVIPTEQTFGFPCDLGHGDRCDACGTKANNNSRCSECGYQFEYDFLSPHYTVRESLELWDSDVT